MTWLAEGVVTGVTVFVIIVVVFAVWQGAYRIRARLRRRH